MGSQNPTAATSVESLVATSTITAGTNVSDSVGTMATIRAGGIGIASQATGDFVFASSATQLGRIAAGTALQYVRRNAANNAYEFGVPPMALIGQAEGTDTTASATNVATFAISGLTVKDSLHIVLRHSSTGNTTASPVLYNTTDSVVIHSVLASGGAVSTGNTNAATIDIAPNQTATTAIVSSGFLCSAGLALAGASAAGTVENTVSVFTTAWTGSWTLALRTGAGGVTAGGTYQYRIAVYRVSGQ